MINIVHGNKADTTKTAEQPKVEKGPGEYEFKDGVAQSKSYSDTVAYYTPLYKSVIQSAQIEFDADKAKAKDKPKDEGYTLKSPFIWVGGIFSNVLSFIGDMFKSIFSICGYGEKADNVENKENKEKSAEKA